MEYIKDWMITVIMLIAGSSILEMASPPGNMKKYVALIYALTVLDALISPIKLFY